MSIIQAKSNIYEVFTRPQTLGLILQHLGLNLNGHRCMGQTAKGTRCSRKNCETTFLCSQHAEMWVRDFCFSLFYHNLSWEIRAENWAYFRQYADAMRLSLTQS